MSVVCSTSGKEPACQCRRDWRLRFNSQVRKILWDEAWQPTPVFLPGESLEQRWATVHRVMKNQTQLKQLRAQAEVCSLVSKTKLLYFFIKIFFIIFFLSFFFKVIFVLSFSYINEILSSSFLDYHPCSKMFFSKKLEIFLEAFDQNFT